jgi:hypothetical protein
LLSISAKVILSKVNPAYSRIAKHIQSSLNETQTQAVLNILLTTNLNLTLERIPLGELRFVEKWNDFDDLHANLASGVCIPPFPEYKIRYGYPHLRVKAITRADRIPLGDELLHPGISEAVAVITTPTQWMQCVLVHEIGHHLIFERTTQLVNIIKPAFLKSQNPISQLASLNWEEYFCETLAAHIMYPTELEKYDQIGYNMIQEALETLRGNP